MTNTPGVYVEEVPTLPPSVAQVATAVPVFIGRTEKGPKGAVKISAIETLLDFELNFGRPKPTLFSADAAGVVIPPQSMVPETPLWYALNLYYANGGSRCYVVSIGNYEDSLKADLFTNGIAELEAEDEPTLVVMPDAVGLTDPVEFSKVAQEALKHCKKMGDRFTILDVQNGAVEDFRGTVDKPGVGVDNLAYGAAYHPYLRTVLTHVYDENAVKVGGAANSPSLASLAKGDMVNTALYNAVKKGLSVQRVELPPSAAIAGVFVRVDRDRGIWKAPANTSLASVIAPTVQITNDQQELLNVDATSGKSINAIRSFTGKGVLVWGARTLAGNDNEWRYVNVRRLFIMIEESAKKASSFAVFESNDASTWLKVKGMLESYLYGLWEQGALQGSKPEDAYRVNVGLGKTMTPQDVLEGRMIVEIGIAAVRPAEFIYLRFSHKLAEA